MSEPINMHKRIAMYGEKEATHLKKGGTAKKYANGGAVMPEAGVRNLPARGDKRNAGVDFNAGKVKVATMKKGGATKRFAGRGR
jgi:hypothetical protein